MVLPKFTAEASLGKSRRTYRTKSLGGGPYRNEGFTSVLPNQWTGTGMLLEEDLEGEELNQPTYQAGLGAPNCNCGR